MKFKIGDIFIVKKVCDSRHNQFLGQKAKIIQIESYTENYYRVSFFNEKLPLITKYGKDGWGVSENKLVPYKPKLKKFLEEFKNGKI